MSKTRLSAAFGYVRVSGKAQIQGDGFERQELAIRSYAKAHGIKIVKFFREQGVSGTKDIADRPAFVDMMEALHGDGVKLVLVESLGRFARDLMIQESILHDLKRSGFDLVSVQEPDLCSDDPSRKLMRQIMGAFHEYEKAMIVIKLRVARQRMKAKTGRCEGQKLYGDLPGEAEVRDRIRSLRQGGATLQSICDALNAENIPTRHGGRWVPMTARNIAER